MSLLKNINKRKYLLNISAILTVISLFIYVFAFSLPHDFHCYPKTDFSVFNSITKSDDTQQTASSTDSDENNHDKDSHNSDKCPVCNLAYFNSLNLSNPLIFDFSLQVTNEKPVYQITTCFSSFTYLKFFLRSPPSFTA